MTKKTKQLRRENNILDANINQVNQAVFTDMICYIKGANISEYSQELVRRDLIEMILSAQERGEGIHDIIKGDFKVFCDDVIDNLPSQNIKERYLRFFTILCSSLAILIVVFIAFSNDTFVLIQTLLKKQTAEYYIGITSGDMLLFTLVILLSVYIVNDITKNAFKKTNKYIFKKIIIGIGIGATLFLISKFGNQVIFRINIFVLLIIVSLLFMMYKILSKILSNLN